MQRKHRDSKARLGVGTQHSHDIMYEYCMSVVESHLACMYFILHGLSVSESCVYMRWILSSWPGQPNNLVKGFLQSFTMCRGSHTREATVSSSFLL